jgi:hypothetical protein
VTSEVEYPQIRYVVPPTRMDGTPSGKSPRMRHNPDCGHLKWPETGMLGEPVLATEEQMHNLPACRSCVERGSESEVSRSSRTSVYGEP